MRFFVVLVFVLLAVGIVSSTITQFKHSNDEPPSETCLVCDGIITIPENDNESQILFKLACDKIENSIGAWACRTLASTIHKTHTWPALRWLLEKVKRPTCALICPK